MCPGNRREGLLSGADLPEGFPSSCCPACPAWRRVAWPWPDRRTGSLGAWPRGLAPKAGAGCQSGTARERERSGQIKRSLPKLPAAETSGKSIEPDAFGKRHPAFGKWLRQREAEEGDRRGGRERSACWSQGKPEGRRLAPAGTAPERQGRPPVQAGAPLQFFRPAGRRSSAPSPPWRAVGKHPSLGAAGLAPAGGASSGRRALAWERTPPRPAGGQTAQCTKKEKADPLAWSGLRFPWKKGEDR